MTNIAAVELFLTVVTWTPDKMLYPMNGPYTLDTIQVREQMGYETQLVARCQTSLGQRDFVITNFPGPMLTSWRYRRPQATEIQRLEDSNNVVQGMSLQPTTVPVPPLPVQMLAEPPPVVYPPLPVPRPTVHPPLPVPPRQPIERPK